MPTETFSIPSVIFCSSQRSGSTMMVDDFSRLCGRESFTTHENFCRMIDDGLFDREDWPKITTSLRELIAREREGLFIENIMYDHAERVSKKISEQEHDKHLTPFYRFFQNAVWVQVIRVDTFEQTVSKYFAAKSGIWDKRQVKGDNYFDSVGYDFNKLYEYFCWFRKSKENWDLFFKANAIEPIVIYYEEAKDSYPDYLKPIFEKVGLEMPADIPKRRLKKLGNHRNLLFKEQFLADLFDTRSKELAVEMTNLKRMEQEYNDILSSRSYKLARKISRFYRTITGKN
ncbi:MAG: Stf0 sulfotransferase family protein [Desulfobulbaceae bacterium]|nr:Stf0 sulfotransferase family protein [Desulfobulbaceae bacterium]